MNDLKAPDTRQALIDTARRLFSERGYDGTSVRAITTEAGANLGAVTYHFGSKEHLYEAVVRETLGPLAGELVAIARSEHPPLDRVEAIVRRHFEHVSTHEEVAPLMLRSVMQIGMPPAAAMPGLRELLQALVGIIRDGQADGTIRPGNPLLMGFGLVSQSVHLTIMQRALRDAMGIDVRDPAQRALVADTLAAFARNGVANHRQES